MPWPTSGQARIGLDAPADLTPIIEEAQRLGFLGPVPVPRHLEHSLGFVDLLASLPADILQRPVLDLGSGGGIPGLVIASIRRPLPTALLEGSSRRSAWLASATERLGLTASVEIIAERAEVAGHSEHWRHGFGAVVARLFGRPAVTAECAAPLLADGGTLIVSEPAERSHGDHPQYDRPGEGAASTEWATRWPTEGLAELGLGGVRRHTPRGYGFVTIEPNSGERRPVPAADWNPGKATPL